MNKAVLVFSGYNQRAVIAFLRTLREKKISFGIVASSANDDVFMTDYAANVIYTRKIRKLELPEFIVSIKQAQEALATKNLIIAPSTEALNRFLLSNRSLIEREGVMIPLVAEDLYCQISDKYSFGKICSDFGILVPKEYNGIDEALIPFVAKPIKYIGKNGKSLNPIIISSNIELESFRALCDIEEYYYQEYIEGRCFYLLYYIYKNGHVEKLSQENYVQQPKGKSMIAAVLSDLHDMPVSKRYEELLKAKSFFGMVMVEVKEKNDVYYMIEANPRFWGPAQLFVDSGFNLFDDFLRENGLIESVKRKESIDAKYYWSGGLKESVCDDDEPTYYIKKTIFESMKNYFVEFDLFDREDTRAIFDDKKRSPHI